MSTPPRIALCPGSFDPVTRGHEDVVRRALAFADRVIVAVGHSAQQQKQGMFTVEERVDLIRAVFADEPRVEAADFTGLLVHFAERTGATLVVRGIRTMADFEYETQMALMNRRMYESLETVFLPAAPDLAAISSTLVRQISTLGGDVEPFVHPSVFARIRARTAGGRA